MQIRADLHVHTNVSDSSCSVGDALKLAKARGLTHIGIVDHDTVVALPEALARGREIGVGVIPGIEISAYHYTRNKKVHILGYAFDSDATNIKALCAPLLSKRTANSLWQVQQLVEAGFPISPAEVKAKAGVSTAIYKQHIMQVLVDKGVTACIYSALYYSLFKNGGLCAREIEYLDVFAAISAIKHDGGSAVLAHPGQLDSFALLDDLVGAGLDGVEINHPAHTRAHKDFIRSLQRRYSLFLTGGSDFHGAYGEAPLMLGQYLCPPSGLGRLIDNT
jgi:predicted metal-dependent phosphoesterase TrpH